jgi:hypothetical protein
VIRSHSDLVLADPICDLVSLRGPQKIRSHSDLAQNVIWSHSGTTHNSVPFRSVPIIRSTCSPRATCVASSGTNRSAIHYASDSNFYRDTHVSAGAKIAVNLRKISICIEKRSTNHPAKTHFLIPSYHFFKDLFKPDILESLGSILSQVKVRFHGD